MLERCPLSAVSLVLVAACSAGTPGGARGTDAGAPNATDAGAAEFSAQLALSVESAKSFTKIGDVAASTDLHFLQLAIKIENRSSDEPAESTYELVSLTTTTASTRSSDSRVTGLLADGCPPGFSVTKGESLRCSTVFEVAGRGTELRVKFVDSKRRFAELMAPVPPIVQCHELAQLGQSAPRTDAAYSLPSTFDAPPEGTFVLTGVTAEGAAGSFPARTMRITGSKIESTTTQHGDEQQSAASFAVASSGVYALKYSCTTPITPDLASLTEEVRYTYDAAAKVLTAYESWQRLTYVRQ